MTNIAVICLGSYNISSWTREDNYDRQSVYSVALSQAIAIAESSTTKSLNLSIDLFIVDNTVANEDEIIPELREQFTNVKVKSVQLVNNNELGKKNKGAGEYFMCRSVIDQHQETLSSYDWIVYYTMRQTIISAKIFEAIADAEEVKENKADVIVGGMFHTFPNGKIIHAPKEAYCDMIFAMRPPQFFSYISSMSPEELSERKMSSEHNLYNFTEQRTVPGTFKRVVLPQDGVMRFDAITHISEIV